MNYVLYVVACFVLSAFPALAQVAGGLPKLQTQVNVVGQQVDSLQSSLLALQKQVDNLSAVIAADDGTAQALVGTWSGTANSVQFRRAVTAPEPGILFRETFFFVFPAGGPSGPTTEFSVVQPQNGLPMTVQVNPEMWLARGDSLVPVTMTIKRSGTALEGTGTASPPGESAASFAMSGAVLSNNFFLMKLQVPASGRCAANGRMILQGTASLNATRTGMIFTGSALEADCSHMVVRVGLTKQP